MKLLFLVVFVLFIWSGLADDLADDILDDPTADPYFVQTITNPTKISSFKFNARIKEYDELEGFEYASSRRYTYVCELQINKNSSGLLCTGSLIDKSWIVTSRACVEGATQILVVCGSKSREKTIKVFSSAAIWPTDTSEYANIALIQVDQPIKMNKYISTIRLPKANTDYTSKNITALSRFRSSSSCFYGTLQLLRLTVIPDASCSIPYSFCSHVAKPEQDFTAGNLGGPSVLKESDGVETLVGINYNSTKNANYGNIQISTNVSNFLQFISLIIGIGATDRLIPGACLIRGQNLTSQDGLSALILRSDGDLGISYEGFDEIDWISVENEADRLCMEANGNVVLYANTTAVWQTYMCGYNLIFVLTNDASLEFYQGFPSTNTSVREIIVGNWD